MSFKLFNRTTEWLTVTGAGYPPVEIPRWDGVHAEPSREIPIGGRTRLQFRVGQTQEPHRDLAWEFQDNQTYRIDAEEPRGDDGSVFGLSDDPEAGEARILGFVVWQLTEGTWRPLGALERWDG